MTIRLRNALVAGPATLVDGVEFAALNVTPEARLDGRVLAVFRAETCGLELDDASRATQLSTEAIRQLEYGALTFAGMEDRIAYVGALEGAREGKRI